MKNVSPNLNISDLKRIGAFKERTYEGRVHTINAGSNTSILDEFAKIKLTDRYYSRRHLYLKHVEIICGNSAESLTVTSDKEINVEFVTLDFCGISVRLTAGQAIDLKDQLRKVNI